MRSWRRRAPGEHQRLRRRGARAAAHPRRVPGRPGRLLAILDDKGATPALVALVRRRLPDGKRYHSTRELLEAVGLAHVEEDPGT